MAESERGNAQTAAIEGKYFDSVVAKHGDFNPFSDRGWQTLRHQFQQRVAGVCPGNPRLLEVGCGTGQSTQIYQGLVRLHVGIDLSYEAVRVAAGNYPKSKWMRSDACQLPFADESFDIVAFSSVLHHIPQYAGALTEAARVLRPGGKIFAFDPNLLHPAMMLFRWPGSPFYLTAGVSPNERPLRARDLRRTFEKAGFNDIVARGQANIAYRYVAPRLISTFLSAYNAADWMLDRSGLGRWFGTFIVTTAQKPPLNQG